jgi:hypothetical protein
LLKKNLTRILFLFSLLIETILSTIMKSNFYNWLLLLLIASNFQAFSQTEATNCGTAKLHNVSEFCNTKNHTVSAGQSEYWIQFTASSESVQLNTAINGLAPVISSIDLLSGSCANLQLLETDSTFSIGDSTVFDASLTVGQAYYLKLNLSSTYDAYFDACLIEKSLENGIFVFTDQYGNTQTCYWTDDMPNTVLVGDSVWSQHFHCDLNFCLTDTICITQLIAPYQITPSNIGSFDFLYAFGNQLNSITYNSDHTEACITFNATGVTTVFASNGYNGPNYVGNTPYNNYWTNNGSSGQFAWDGDCQWYLDLNVIDQTPQATPNQASTICLGGAYSLTTFPGTVLTSVSLNNVPQPIPDPAFWSTILPGGQHIINYTVDGLCQPASYSDTIIIIDTTDVSMTIDACNHASFTFQTCDVFTTLEFSDGLGNLIPITPVNGFAAWTIDYSNISTAVTWTLNGWQQIQVSPIQYGIVFTESQVVLPAIPAPIITNAPSHLCDLTAAGISITGSSGLQNIVWTTSPATATFTGQGTTSIFPNSWSTTASNVTVNIAAVDSNGCPYSATMILQVCCEPDADGTEFFERTYVNNAQFQTVVNQLPVGYYNGPSLPIALNLAAPQPVANQIATIYSAPTTLTNFISANPGLFASGPLETNNWIFFNHDFIVDKDLTINNTHFIRFAPGKRMLIQPGISVTINNSTIAAKCDSMWGGIHIPDATASLTAYKANLVAAIKAVHSESGGYYKITYSNLIDNYASIWVENYTILPTTSSAEANYFGDVINQNLMAPYNTEAQPVYGVYIKKIKDITVGPLTAAMQGNLFHNHKVGIYDTLATLRVFRNTFFNIKRTTGTASGDTYVAIKSRGNAFVNTNLLEVGSSPITRNNFVNCETGISSNTNMHLTAKFNYMKGCQLRGISAENNRAKTILITNNEINATISNAWGIYVKNYALGSATIDYNQINTTNVGVTSFTRFAAGIYVASVNPGSIQTTFVRYNKINNCLYGIWMINTAAGQLKNNQITINMTNTQIDNATLNFAPIRGIVVQNSQKAEVWSNMIDRNMGTGNGVSNDNLQAIRLEVSPSSYIWKNTMNKTAVGFYALGSSLGSRVECNSMNFNRNGFWMQAADISDQGAPAVGSNPGISAHNVWTNCFSSNSDGFIINHAAVNPLNYFHANPNMLNSQPSSQLIFSFWSDITLMGTTNNTCGNALAPIPLNFINPSQNRKRELSAIIGGNQLYDSLDLEMKHYLKYSAFNRLKHDSTMVYLNAPDDFLYQNYLNSMDTTDFAKSFEIQENMMDNEYDSVSIKLNQFNSSDQRMQLIKVVETIWNNSQLNFSPIQSTDSLILIDIACLDPLINGSGVYQARAILDWDGFCKHNDNKSAQVFNNENEVSFSSSTIYPNPSNGEFKIKSSEMIKSIIIYDLKGVKLVEYKAYNSSEIINSNLKTGVYLIKVHLENDRIETHKISIY